MKCHKKSNVFIATLALCACQSGAELIFDNASTTDTDGGYFTHDGRTAFDSFSVGNVTVEAIELEMAEYISSIDEIIIEVGIWTDVNSGNIFSQSFDLSLSPLASYSLIAGGDYDLYNIALDITDIELEGSYWLSVQTSGDSGGGLMLPYNSDPVDGDDSFVHYISSSNTEYTRTQRELSFELYGSIIPEPATLILFSLGGFGSWILRRNRIPQRKNRRI